MKEKFYKALVDNDINLLNQIPKSDLHNHSTRGTNRKIFENKYGVIFPEVPKFYSISDMDNWYNATIDQYCCGRTGFIERLTNLFIQVENENVIKFAPSFCLDMSKHFNGNIKEYIDFLKHLKDVYAPSIDFIPELSIKRTDNVEQTEREFDEAIKYDFFKSIDLMGDEALGTSMFIDLYKKAQKKGLVLKSHVGEFTSAKFIEQAIDDLNLDVLNHGLSAIESPNLMNEISRLKIMINTCPTSNLLLSRVKSYRNHPIREFYNRGIVCTINTDDLLIFNQSISEEYLNLYNNGTLGKEELNHIRENGISKCLCKRRK